MVSHSIEATASRLTTSLEETLLALARLHASTDRLRPTDEKNSAGLASFPSAQLDRLSAMISKGAADITRRVKQLSGEDVATSSHLAELWRRGSAAFPGDRIVNSLPDSNPHPRSLLATYRAACRALCTAVQEARQAGDTSTVVLLSALLQNLEKQLWLLDSSRVRRCVGASTIDLFLSC